jgi:hypothetical protein
MNSNFFPNFCCEIFIICSILLIKRDGVGFDFGGNGTNQSVYKLGTVYKFYRFKLTVETCCSYIDHLRTVIPIIIERRNDWSYC